MVTSVRNGAKPGLAVLYDRASTQGQRNNWSRDDAARFLDKVVAEHGYEGEVRQEIKSGEDLRNRPVMKQLLEDIADGKVAALVCQDFSRISRDEDGLDGRLVRQVCRDAGVVIITQEKTYDFANDSDDLLADLNFFVAKLHKRQSITAMTRGIKEKALQGKWLPSYAIYGYEWTERWPDEDAPLGVKPGAKKPGADLVIVPEEAEIVRRIFNEYEARSQRQIAKRLSEEGLHKPVRSRAWRVKEQTKEQGQRLIVDRKKPRTERDWIPNDIADIISNPLYAGLLTYGTKCTSRFMKDFGGVQHHRPDLQIVTMEQFNRCQHIKKERHRHPGLGTGTQYIFSGLIRCRFCGGRMVGKRQLERRAQGNKEVHKRYECRAFHVQGRIACQGQSIYETTAKKAVLPALVHLLREHLCLDDALKEAADEMSRPNAGQRKDDYQAELQKIASAQERLVDAVAEGLLTPDAIRRKQLDLMEKREYYEKRLAALDRNREATSEIAEALRLVQGDLAELLENAPIPQLARLCQLVFRCLSIETEGPPTRRTGKIVSYEYTAEFADLLAAHAHTVNTDKPAWLIVWCGARKGRCVISGVSEGSRPLTL